MFYRLMAAWMRWEIRHSRNPQRRETAVRILQMFEEED